MSSRSHSPSQPNYPPPPGYESAYKYDNQFDQPIPRSYPDPLHAQYAAQSQEHKGQYTPEPQRLAEQAQWASQPAQEDIRAAPQSDTKARLRKACDSCSVRKVKCDESGPPCKSCAALEIPCTFNRPSRRRGPPNKHAEAIKRQRLGEDGAYAVPGSSPTHDAAYSLAALATPSRLSAESICDLETLNILINDYFIYIHPLVPVPHEPSFRAAFARRDDRTDRTFLTLLAAMVEALVASFPRRPRQLFTSEHARKQFPSAGVLIDRCQQVLNEARGLGHLDKSLTLYDAIASYLAGLAAGYTFDVVRASLYFGECMMVLRALRYHERHQDNHDPVLANAGPSVSTIDIQPANYIDRETGCRLFWLCFVSRLSIRQLGEKDSDLLMPPLSPSEKLPQMPLEIDDEYIFADQISPQSPNVVSMLTGFNLNVNVFQAFHALTALEMAFGTDELYDWDRQKNVIRHTLAKVKAVTVGVSPELQLVPSDEHGSWPPTANLPSAYTHSFHERQDPYADVVGLPAPHNGPGALPYSKRAIQCEIQKANIYASQLASRSYLVEKFWNLYEIKDRHSGLHGTPTSASSPTTGIFAAGIDRMQSRQDRPPGSDGMDAGEQAMSVEREDIVHDLGLLLRCINQVNMEPNGLSFCYKIRQVASTLLHTPRSRMATMPTLDAESVNSYLVAFLEILRKLERLGVSRVRGELQGSDENGGEMSIEAIEEEELIHWASLKEHQERFARRNEFIDTA